MNRNTVLENPVCQTVRWIVEGSLQVTSSTNHSQHLTFSGIPAKDHTVQDHTNISQIVTTMPAAAVIAAVVIIVVGAAVVIVVAAVIVEAAVVDAASRIGFAHSQSSAKSTEMT